MEEVDPLYPAVWLAKLCMKRQSPMSSSSEWTSTEALSALAKAEAPARRSQLPTGQSAYLDDYT